MSRWTARLPQSGRSAQGDRWRHTMARGEERVPRLAHPAHGEQQQDFLADA